eukprot:1256002-Pleurochrysis_carterae.AAC.3
MRGTGLLQVPKDARGKAVDNSSEVDEAGHLQIFYSFNLDAAQLMSSWDVAAYAGCAPSEPFSDEEASRGLAACKLIAKHSRYAVAFITASTEHQL